MKYYYYHIYGLVLKTEQFIEQLICIKPSKEIDLFIEFRKETTNNYSLPIQSKCLYSSYKADSQDLPSLSVFKSHGKFIIRYVNLRTKDKVFFNVDQTTNYLTISYPSKLPLQDILTYLTGPVIGCILRLKKKVCLHASVVNIKGKAIAFIGAKTAGKSTLIATFAALGYPILSDDIAVLFERDNEYFVKLGYPRMRLWKNTVENLPNINTEDLQPVLSHIEKYYLPLSTKLSNQWNFQKQSLPLDKVFFLQPRNEDNISQIIDCKPLEGFLKLKQNIYAEYMLEDDLKAKEFEVFGKLSNLNKVKLLDRPNDLDKLKDICALISQNV